MAYGEPNYDIAPPPWYGKIREGTPPPVNRFTPPNAGVSPSFDEKQMLIDARLGPGFVRKVADRFTRAYYGDDDGSGTPPAPTPTPTTPTTPRTPRTHGGRRRPPTTGTTPTSTPTTPATPTATPTTPIVTPTTPATTPATPVTLRTPTRTVVTPPAPPTSPAGVPTSPLVPDVSWRLPPFDSGVEVPPPPSRRTRATEFDWRLPPVDTEGAAVPPPPKRSSRAADFDWDLPPMAETGTGLPVGPLATSVPPPPGAPVETPTLPTGTWSVPEGYGDVLSPDWRRRGTPEEDVESIFTPRVPGPAPTREITDEEFLNNFLNMGKSRTKKRPPKG